MLRLASFFIGQILVQSPLRRMNLLMMSSWLNDRVMGIRAPWRAWATTSASAKALLVEQRVELVGRAPGHLVVDFSTFTTPGRGRFLVQHGLVVRIEARSCRRWGLDVVL